jgi:molybdopterin molybdotransferase
VLASCGPSSAPVSARPRVAVLVTGDELVPPGTALGYGQIHDSNRYALSGLLHGMGIDVRQSSHVRDDPKALGDELLEASRTCDVVITSGGVSAGEADFMPQLLADIGQVYFWKVRMKPGMPFLCGRVGRALVCGLPGNPVSGYATFLALLKPALEAMQNARPAANALRARLREPLRKNHARSEFRRATLACDDSGVLWASALAQQGSGMLRGVAEADALIVLPETAREYAQGEVLEILPLPGWMAGRV